MMVAVVVVEAAVTTSVAKIREAVYLGFGKSLTLIICGILIPRSDNNLTHGLYSI